MWARKQESDGSEYFVASGGNSENSERGSIWDFGNANNPNGAFEASMGRGVTSTSRTYVKLCRTDGTPVYISVDTGTTVVCSTAQP